MALEAYPKPSLDSFDNVTFQIGSFSMEISSVLSIPPKHVLVSTGALDLRLN